MTPDKQNIAEYLRKLTHQSFLQLPLTLHLQPNAEPLVCKRVLRFLPGKRLVVFATWRDKDIVAKIFFHPQHAKRHAQREITGAHLLKSFDILAPALLHADKILDTEIEVLIFERIFFAKSFYEAWVACDSNEKKQILLNRLMIVMAQHHYAGVKQKDLHLDNFLLSGRNIFTLDSANFEFHQHALMAKKSLPHLGELFAQFPLQEEELFLAALFVYKETRGWKTTIDVLWKQLLSYRNTALQKRKKAYLKKIFRTGTHFHTEKNRLHYLVCKRRYYTPAMQELLDDPDSFMTVTGEALLKNGNTCTVARVHIDNMDLVIKRYNIKSFFHGLKRAFQKSRAEICWRNAHRLLFFNIATAMPIAFIIKKRVGLFNSQAYFISEYVPGVPIKQLLQLPGLDKDQKEMVVDSVKKLFHVLRRLNLRHGDMKTQNFLWAKQKPYLIDLDAMQEYRCNFLYERGWRKDIKRFMRDWQDMPEMTEMWFKKGEFICSVK